MLGAIPSDVDLVLLEFTSQPENDFSAIERIVRRLRKYPKVRRWCTWRRATGAVPVHRRGDGRARDRGLAVQSVVRRRLRRPLQPAAADVSVVARAGGFDGEALPPLRHQLRFAARRHLQRGDGGGAGVLDARGGGRLRPPVQVDARPGDHGRFGRARAAASLGRASARRSARVAAAGGAAAPPPLQRGGAPPVQGRRRRHLVAVLRPRADARAQRAATRRHAGRRPRQRQLRARGRRGGARVEGVPPRAARRGRTTCAAISAAGGCTHTIARHPARKEGVVGGRGDLTVDASAPGSSLRRRAPPRRCESGGGEEDGDGAAAMPMAEARHAALRAERVRLADADERRMGAARVTCVDGCECAPTLDASRRATGGTSRSSSSAVRHAGGAVHAALRRHEPDEEQRPQVRARAGRGGVGTSATCSCGHS